MDASTRPPQYRRQRLGHLLPGLAAVLIFASANALASPGKSDETSAISQAPAPFDNGANTEISVVAKGSEGLSLSARFSSTGQALAKDVAWTIQDHSGAVVYDDKAAFADVKLQPGTYVVNAQYGNAHLEQAINLPDGIKLGVNFVLNAGGLRLLPRIEGELPTDIGSVEKIYALSGRDAGRLVATSIVPGEILKLAAGSYRIESSFERGNEVAVTEVKVKPGILTAVDIDHHAALVHVAFGKDSSAAVTWDIRSGTGEALPEFIASAAAMVLKPGRYLASARKGLEFSFQSFTIEPGKNQTVILGN